MPSFNRVILVGNVTHDPELKYLPSGTAVLELSLAVNERRKSGDGYVEETTFVNCVLFGRTAEVAGEYVSKGKPLLISGRLKMDSWEKDGKKFTKLKVIAEQMQFLGDGKKPVAEAAPAEEAAAADGF